MVAPLAGRRARRGLRLSTSSYPDISHTSRLPYAGAAVGGALRGSPYPFR